MSLPSSSPSSASLVKFDPPVLVSTSADPSKLKGKAATKDASALLSSSADLTSLSPSSPSVPSDLLTSILPPREWTVDGSLWVQYVSSTPATRQDVLHLHHTLTHRLSEQGAKESGICPIREELIAQTFDELIRQITLNCAERGVLLLRVRDELKMRVAAYSSLYESSISYGMRRAMGGENKRAEMENYIKYLEKEVGDMEKTESEWRERIDQLERKERERRAEESLRYNAEVEQLQQQNAKLKREIDQMIALPSNIMAAIQKAGFGPSSSNNRNVANAPVAAHSADGAVAAATESL